MTTLLNKVPVSLKVMPKAFLILALITFALFPFNMWLARVVGDIFGVAGFYYLTMAIPVVILYNLLMGRWGKKGIFNIEEKKIFLWVAICFSLTIMFFKGNGANWYSLENMGSMLHFFLVATLVGTILFFIVEAVIAIIVKMVGFVYQNQSVSSVLYWITGSVICVYISFHWITWNLI